MTEKARPVPRVGRQLTDAMIMLRRQEAEIGNAKDLYFQLAARLLRLELAVSLLSPEARETVFPSEPQDRVRGGVA